MAEDKKNILIVEARFYDDIADLLATGATRFLDRSGAGYHRVAVQGALEIPQAVAIAQSRGGFDGFVALGCVIRGETAHYDIVANLSAHGLMTLSIDHGLAIGNGILTVENREQARVRASQDGKDKGAAAAMACLDLVKLRDDLAGVEL